MNPSTCGSPCLTIEAAARLSRLVYKDVKVRDGGESLTADTLDGDEAEESPTDGLVEHDGRRILAAGELAFSYATPRKSRELKGSERTNGVRHEWRFFKQYVPYINASSVRFRQNIKGGVFEIHKTAR